MDFVKRNLGVFTNKMLTQITALSTFIKSQKLSYATAATNIQRRSAVITELSTLRYLTLFLKLSDIVRDKKREMQLTSKFLLSKACSSKAKRINHRHHPASPLALKKRCDEERA